MLLKTMWMASIYGKEARNRLSYRTDGDHFTQYTGRLSHTARNSGVITSPLPVAHMTSSTIKRLSSPDHIRQGHSSRLGHLPHHLVAGFEALVEIIRRIIVSHGQGRRHRLLVGLADRSLQGIEPLAVILKLHALLDIAMDLGPVVDASK